MKKGKKMKRKNNFDKLFLLSWKRFVISAMIFVMIFFFRHKTIRPIFEPLGIYDIVFNILSYGIPLYLLISLFYTKIIRKIKLKKSKKTNLFLLSWKKTGIALIVWVVAVVIHNMIYAFFVGVLGIEFEEPVFFLFAMGVIPVYFIVSIIYTIIKKLKKRR